MQTRNKDGTYGDIEPFSQTKMNEKLQDPNVDHIEVFMATEENLQARKRLLGVKKRYQKAPKNRKS